MKLKEKNINAELEKKLNEVGVQPDLARIYAARKIDSTEQINYKLDKLLPPQLLAFEYSGWRVFMASNIR